MQLDNNLIIEIIGLVVTLIFGLAGLWNKLHSNSMQNVKDSSIVQNVAQGNNNTIIYHGDSSNDAIINKMNSLADDFIDNHNRWQKDKGTSSLMEQCYNIAFELSTMVLEGEYDANRIPKLRTAFVCLQEDMQFT